jgi:hypothetical protein
VKKSTYRTAIEMQADLSRAKAAAARRAKFDQRRFGASPGARSKITPPSAP